MLSTVNVTGTCLYMCTDPKVTCSSISLQWRGASYFILIADIVSDDTF